MVRAVGLFARVRPDHRAALLCAASPVRGTRSSIQSESMLEPLRQINELLPKKAILPRAWFTKG
jgi:hypothetical protein